MLFRSNALRQHVEVAAAEFDASETGVFEALKDDLNTPKAIAALHASAKALNKASPAEVARAKGELMAGAALMGLLAHDPEAWFTATQSEQVSAETVEQLIAERIAAKAKKDYARADEIREQLSSQGVVLEDGADGTSWRRA